MSGLGAAPAAPALGLPALLLPKEHLASGQRFGEDHPSLPGHVHACVPSHGHQSGVARTQGLCSGLLCLSFPRKSGVSLAESRSPAKAQPWMSRPGSMGWPPSHPPTVPRLQRGRGARGFLPASSFRRTGPAVFPAADSARVPLRPPHRPWGRWLASVPPQLPHGFHPAVPSPRQVIFFLPSPGDPPGLPPLLHAPGVLVGPTETPCRGVLQGGLGVMPPRANCPRGTSLPSHSRVPGWLMPGPGIAPFGEGRARSWCPRWAGVRSPHGGSGQSWSLGHGGHSERLGRSLA